MTIDRDEFQEAEEELERIVEDPSVLEEDYTNVTEEFNRNPDQLIWAYIYRNVTGSLRKELVGNPPSSFPDWLRELFREEYIADGEGLPADDFINKAFEHFVRRRITV